MTAIRLATALAILLALAGCATVPAEDGARFRGSYGGVTAGGASGR